MQRELRAIQKDSPFLSKLSEAQTEKLLADYELTATTK